MTPATVALIALAVVAALALVFLVGYNRLVTLRNRTEAAWADLDVQLTRRGDLIPDLVATVRAYAAHERATLEEVTAARVGTARAGARSERAAAEDRTDRALGRVVALAEAYPDLQADERFRELHDELVATENKIAFSRQLYNDTVTVYRDATQSFPGLLYAGSLGFEAPERFATEG